MIMDNISLFKKSIKWIDNYTIDGNGISVTSNQNVIYPEVTGYYIPTLLKWGERDKALSYAKYLCSIQKDDGSWFDSQDMAPYVFDSAQILKGLLAIRDILPDVDSCIIKGCNWILSNVKSDGRLITPNKDAWGTNEDFCSELIHIYCLSPIKEAGVLFNKPEYFESVNKILSYYLCKKRDKIINFSLLSHFYAYVMEGLYDLGEIKLCHKAMNRLEKYRNATGEIPGLKNVSWVCSTGLFQLALVWYKLGDLKRGNSLFEAGLKYQNQSGGWFGSYPTNKLLHHLRRSYRPYYFPDEEISWAVKYFLDALAWKEKLEFESQASSFLADIDAMDGRYRLVRKITELVSKSFSINIAVCDAGCGKGRYLKRLIEDCKQNDYYAFDISDTVMRDINNVKKKAGTLTDIPYEDDTFHFTYCCEAFEHAIHLKTAFNELYRVTKDGGVVLIIDKPVKKLGKLELDEWEQWIDDKDILRYAKECGGRVKVVKSIPYENKNDGLFRGWIIQVRKSNAKSST